MIALSPVVPHLADAVHALHKARPRLRHVTVEVTRRCPLRCGHCFAASGPGPRRGELSFLELCALGFSIRRDFGRRVVLSVTGGEPLTRRDLFLVLRFWRVLGLPIALSTNGWYVDARRAARLARHVLGLAVSLDGLPATHEALRGPGTFERAARALGLAVRAGIPKVVAKTAVHPGNLAEIPRLLDVLRRLGVREWHLFPVEPAGRARSILDAAGYAALCRLFDRLKSDPEVYVCFGEQNSWLRTRPALEAGLYHRCNAGIASLAVLAGGEVVPCVQGPRTGAAVQGRLREERLRDIWRRGFREQRSRGWRRCGLHRHLAGPGISA